MYVLVFHGQRRWLISRLSEYETLATHVYNIDWFFRYGHMIDNVVLIVTGTLHERDVHELLEKCHPLGMFDRFGPFYFRITLELLCLDK